MIDETYKISPIFFIGVGRTGSVMLMNMLNMHRDVFIDNEINFRFFMKKCIYSELKKVGTLKNDNNVKKIFDIIFNNKIPNAVPITGNLQRRKIEKDFLISDRSYKSLFELIIKSKADQHKKKRWGAKFPVHFMYLNMLLAWYPNSKILYLTRDPRAIYSSELIAKRKETTARQFPINPKNPFFKISILLYVALQWTKSQRIYNKFKKNYNIRLVKYEDVVENAVLESKNICTFLNISFDNNLTDIQVDNSSYNDQVKDGFNKLAINRWRKEINNFEKLFIDIITYRQRKKIGYK